MMQNVAKCGKNGLKKLCCALLLPHPSGFGWIFSDSAAPRRCNIPPQIAMFGRWCQLRFFSVCYAIPCEARTTRFSCEVFKSFLVHINIYGHALCLARILVFHSIDGEYVPTRFREVIGAYQQTKGKVNSRSPKSLGSFPFPLSIRPP